MRIVVSDTSCLIDLRKTFLLEAFARLPYEILIPDVLFEEELVKFTQADRSALTGNGVKIVETPESGVERVMEVRVQNVALSINDCFAYVVAESHADSILVTGDKGLRSLAVRSNIETHGVLWIIDEIHKYELATPEEIHKALTLFENDDTVRLPAKELRARLNFFAGLLR